jgi:hypothetical protein
MLFSLGLSSHPVRPSLVRLVIVFPAALLSHYSRRPVFYFFLSLFLSTEPTNEWAVCVSVCVRSNFVIVFLPFRCRWCIHITPSTSKEKKQLSDTKDPVLISSKKFRMSIIAERIYLFYFPANEKKEWGKTKVIDGMRDKSEPAPACRSQWQQIIQCRYHFSPSDSVSQPATHIYPLLTI